MGAWPKTEMAPYLIWAPGFFGPQAILAPHENDVRLGTKFLGAQISQGPNFLGAKKVRSPNEIMDHFSYSHRCTIISTNSTYR